MIWLIVSILSTAGFFVLFKYFDVFQIRIFPAIVVNYFTCFIIGIILEWDLLSSDIGHQAVFTDIKSIGIGLLFIAVFNATGFSTNRAGAGVTGVASKMSVIIPVLVAALFLKEKLSTIQWLGLIPASISVYLISDVHKDRSRKPDIIGIVLLLLVFFGSGSVDTALQLVKNMPSESHISVYLRSTAIFMWAGIWGLAVWLILWKKFRILNRNELIGGVLLGIVNFTSLVSLFNALDIPFKNRSAHFFIFNNMGVMVVTSLIGMLLFHEKLSKKQWLGVIMAIAAIFLIQ